MSTTPALFANLLDDAAMFPPGNATASDAITAHLRYRRSGTMSALVGPLLVPTGSWAEFLTAYAKAGSPPLAVTVIGTATMPDDVPPGLDVVGFELAVDAPPLPDDTGTASVAYEVTYAADRQQLLAAVAERLATGRPVIAKYRTGGTGADAFPSDRALGDVLNEAAQVDAPLKFTAGLHNAVRRTDPATGFEHHGFLNLMVATSRARSGAGHAAVLAALRERDPTAVTAEVESWTATEVSEVRSGFVSFGCCGVDEPVADLVKLGLFDGGAS